MNAHTSIIVLVSCMAVALIGKPAAVNASITEQVVTYNILEDSSDPQSDVIFSVTFEMTQAGQMNDSIGWQVLSAYFEQPLASGGSRVWKTDSVKVDTSDGLWWVEHENTDDPIPSEFDVPPAVLGTAAPYNGQFASSLIYDFAGLSGSPGLDKARVQYSFKLDDEEDPEAEDDDDIVEIDRDPNLPQIMVGAESCRSDADESTDLVAMLLALSDDLRTRRGDAVCLPD